MHEYPGTAEQKCPWENRLTQVFWQQFRSSDGSAMNETSCLELKLSDFATDVLTSVDTESVSLTVSFRKLYDFLIQAEERHQALESTGGARSKRITLKRRRSSSPAEQLRSEDEARIAALERAADTTHQDSDFEPGKRRRCRKPR